MEVAMLVRQFPKMVVRPSTSTYAGRAGVMLVSHASTLRHMQRHCHRSESVV